MKKFLYAALLLGAAIQFTACESDDSPVNPKQRYDLTQGMVIVNEGNYNKTNASISLYYSNGDSLTNDVYNKVNNEELGNTLQSIAMADTSAYLIVNGSDKIVAVSKYSCKKYAMIPAEGPRYMVVNGKTGYVSLWKTNEIAVIDLTKNTIKQRIAVGIDPEGMAIYNNKLYVANSSYSFDESKSKSNTVSVINLSNNTVEKNITVADRPMSIVLDKNGNVWVLCAGYSEYGNPAATTNAALCKINPATNEVTKIDLGPNFFDRLQISPAKDKIYYSSSWNSPAGIFQMDVTATTAPTSPFISGDFYGFAINPSNGEIMAMVASYSDPTHKMIRYNNISGEKIKEYSVGIYPNGGYFFN